MTTTPSRPKISIIIPAYNEAETIATCLESVKNQTVAPDEIIVVDNNSKDDTTRIAATFDGVRIISETEKQGIVPARDAGLNSATGDILCRIDADSIIPRDWVENIAEHFATHPQRVAEIYGVAGSADFDIPQSKLLSRVLGVIVFDIIFFPISRLMLGGNTLFGSNMAITKTAWNATKAQSSGQDTVLEDVHLSARILDAGGTVEHIRNRIRVSPRSLMEPPRKSFSRFKMWPGSAKRTHKK